MKTTILIFALIFAGVSVSAGNPSQSTARPGTAIYDADNWAMNEAARIWQPHRSIIFKPRTWTDSKGNSVFGTILGLDATQQVATIQINGNQFRIRLSDLRQEDARFIANHWRQYLAALNASRMMAGAVPVASQDQSKKLQEQIDRQQRQLDAQQRQLKSQQFMLDHPGTASH